MLFYWVLENLLSDLNQSYCRNILYALSASFAAFCWYLLYYVSLFICSPYHKEKINKIYDNNINADEGKVVSNNVWDTCRGSQSQQRLAMLRGRPAWQC